MDVGAYEKAKHFSALLTEREYLLGVDLEDFASVVNVEELAHETDEKLRALDSEDLPPCIVVFSGDAEVTIAISGKRGEDYQGRPDPVGSFAFLTSWRG